MIVKRLNPTTIMVDNVKFSKMGYDGNYTSFDSICTDNHYDSLDLFLAVEEQEQYKPTALEMVMSLPICLS